MATAAPGWSNAEWGAKVNLGVVVEMTMGGTFLLPAGWLRCSTSIRAGDGSGVAPRAPFNAASAATRAPGKREGGASSGILKKREEGGFRWNRRGMITS